LSSEAGDIVQISFSCACDDQPVTDHKELSFVIAAQNIRHFPNIRHLPDIGFAQSGSIGSCASTRSKASIGDTQCS
jgi:hypothetical protein